MRIRRFELNDLERRAYSIYAEARLQRASNLTEAMKGFRHLRRLVANLPSTSLTSNLVVFVGDSYQRRKRAIPWYRRALELDPENSDAMYELAVINFNLGKKAIARSLISKALANLPEFIEDMVLTTATEVYESVCDRRGLRQVALIRRRLENLKHRKAHHKKKTAMKKA